LSEGLNPATLDGLTTINGGENVSAY